MVITLGGLWLVRLPLAMLLTGPLACSAWIASLDPATARGTAVFLRFRSGRWARIKV